jgi:hypothetical protein
MPGDVGVVGALAAIVLMAAAAAAAAASVVFSAVAKGRRTPRSQACGASSP